MEFHYISKLDNSIIFYLSSNTYFIYFHHSIIVENIKLFLIALTNINIYNRLLKTTILNYNNKQIISNYITKNSKIEKYTLLGYDDSNSIQSEDFYAQQSKHFNTSLHNEKTESDEANNTIVNEIIKSNPTKGEEMIQLIESILSHSNKKKKC